MTVFSCRILCCNDTNNIFSAFMDVVGQRRSIVLLWCSLKLKSDIICVVIKCTRCCNAERILQLDPPTNAAIGPSPAQRRAATSKILTTCTPTSDVILYPTTPPCDLNTTTYRPDGGETVCPFRPTLFRWSCGDQWVLLPACGFPISVLK